MFDVRRREFITLLGGAAAVWPVATRAQQQTRIPRIGIIDDSSRWNALRHELRDLGYLEGQNIAFDYAYRHDFGRRSGAGPAGDEPRASGRERHWQYHPRPRHRR